MLQLPSLFCLSDFPSCRHKATCSGLVTPSTPSFLDIFPRLAPPQTDLHGQADGVEQDEDEHQILEVGGVDHVPHFVLVLVLGDIPSQGSGLKGIFHTLSLKGMKKLRYLEKE